MTLPANIRVNTSAPFPALVKASGPVTISKQNGIWTVGFQIASLAVVPAGTPPGDIAVLVYNTLTNAFQQTTVAALLSGDVVQTIVTHAMSPYPPIASDIILLVDTTGGPVEIDLSLAVLRNGVSLSIKDYKGNAAVNNITIKPQGAPANETVDNFTNAAPLVLAANYDGVRLLPIPNGYIIAP